MLIDWFKANRLSLNIAKTNFMYFKRVNTDKDLELQFGNINLTSSLCVKFLGVHIDAKLNWKFHTEYIKNKISSGLYALKRLKLLLPQCVLRTLYFSLIESYLNYGLTVWGGTFKTYIKPISIMQKKCIRTIGRKPYNYPTKELFITLRILNYDNLYQLCLGKLMYRFDHGLAPESLLKLFIRNQNLHNYHTRQHNCPHICANNCSAYSQSYLHKAPTLWLNLDNNFKLCTSLSQFKSKFKKYLINNDNI